MAVFFLVAAMVIEDVGIYRLWLMADGTFFDIFEV
jgi:hypothetical protein